MYIFGLRIMAGGGGVFNFAVAGIALLSTPLDSPNPWLDHVQVDTPLHFIPTDGRGEIIFGAGIMANTAEAGATHPDGYIYIYGTQNDPFIKKLVAARVLPSEFEDFSKWRYWNGAAWSPDIETVAPLASRVSSELSVSPLPDGRVVLVFQLDTLGRDVAVRIGESPVGPWRYRDSLALPGAGHRSGYLLLQRQGPSPSVPAWRAAHKLQRQYLRLFRPLRQRRHLPSALHQRPQSSRLISSPNQRSVVRYRQVNSFPRRQIIAFLGRF